MRRRFMLATAGALAGLVAACSSPPPPPPPTIVNVTLVTGTDANPTPSGQGAPVVVRVYQLSSSAGFEKAEFYRLFNQDAATLGADMVKRDEFLLPPGSSKTIKLEPAPNVMALGVFAAYRDFGKVTWRAVTPVPPHQTTDVSVKADASGIALVAKSAPPPAKPGS